MIILFEFNPNWLAEQLCKYSQVNFILFRSGISSRIHQETTVAYNKVHRPPANHWLVELRRLAPKENSWLVVAQALHNNL